MIIGATVVTDGNINTKFGNEDVTIMGADVIVPFETKTGIKCRVYGEYSKIADRGDCGTAGLFTDLGRLTWKIEYRRFSTDYIPNYFNHLYDLEREYKANRLYSLPEGKRVSGWLNEVSLSLSNELKARVGYEENDNSYEDSHFFMGVSYKESYFNKFKFSLDYDRKNVYYSINGGEEDIYNFNATYDVNGFTHLIYNFKQILDSEGNPANSINLETRIVF